MFARAYNLTGGREVGEERCVCGGGGGGEGEREGGKGKGEREKGVTVWTLTEMVVSAVE